MDTLDVHLFLPLLLFPYVRLQLIAKSIAFVPSSVFRPSVSYYVIFMMYVFNLLVEFT